MQAFDFYKDYKRIIIIVLMSIQNGRFGTMR